MEQENHILSFLASKKRKLYTARVDRLSGLPDVAICHILSFLTTKESAQTCILAKRWRSLWAHVPTIDFDRKDYGKGSLTMGRIINRIMMLHKGAININTFYLKNKSSSCDIYDLETWIANVIAHNVQNMKICLDYQLYLPQCLFSCKTLVNLRLTKCRLEIPSTATVQFPSLKKLTLEGVLFEPESSLRNLVSGCPVLEELIDVESTLFFCNVISSPTLKRLDINSNPRYVENKWHEVKLNTPALTYLRLHDCVTNEFSAGALTSLVEADVHFYRADEERDVSYCCSVLEFVGAMSNVKSLRLSTCLMDADDDDDAFSDLLTMKFHNLTNLQLLKADWRFISFFLENADNLQVLDIRMHDRRIKNWTEPDRVAVCVSKHLRKVTIRDFGSEEGEFELVSYLLRNGKVMKLMDIHLLEHGDGELDAVKRITKCCGASHACDLVFHCRDERLVF